MKSSVANQQRTLFFWRSTDIQVQEKVFGNVLQNSSETIWQSSHYEEFRKESGQYEYSSCWSCSQRPCSNLINDTADYANDCYGSQVPCGHCQWNLGGIRCL
ncbi:MAG: SPASM domain-containing protein [Proteobacteria bacterium]|nr:SPASM domain-containing protein [Pseudomonadota bacterium]MBU1456630.1 SPASM domain-containing protein [Pseudomonadota bacterium]